MAICTAAEYKTWAGISGTDLDTWLAAVIAQAQDGAEEWCGRGFDSAARTEYYSGTGTTDMSLRTTPVTTLTSVSYLSSVSAGVASFTAFDGGTYYFDGDSGLLVRYSAFDAFDDANPVWPDGTRNIKVVYTAGYSTIPDGLKLAGFRLIDYLRDMRGKSGGLQSESMGSYSYTLAAVSPGEADELYVRFGFLPWKRMHL